MRCCCHAWRRGIYELPISGYGCEGSRGEAREGSLSEVYGKVTR